MSLTIASGIEDASGPADGGPVRTAYVVAEFRGGACDTVKLDATFRYAATEPEFDFSRTMPIRPPLEAGAVTTIFFPAYLHQPRSGDPVAAGYGLQGLELPEGSIACLTGLARVRDLAGLPLMLNLELRPHWEGATPYQTIEGWETRDNDEAQPEIYAFPRELPVTRSMLQGKVEAFAVSDVRRLAETVEFSDAGLKIRGVGGIGGRGRFMYLAEMKSTPVQRGRILVAEGAVARGGFSLGLVREGQWLAQAAVTRGGRFIVVVAAPEDGVYSVVLANNLPGPSLWNEFTIRKVGWVVPR